MGEIHGMSQRGGSVSSQIRYGEKVESAVIELGGADILIAFEKMEALRWLEYLKPEGKAIVNNYEINPVSVLSGKVDYPANIIGEISETVDTMVVDSAEHAERLGNPRVMNVILLGATVKSMGLEHIDWEKIIKENIKQQFIDINIKALKQGMDLIK